MGGPGGRRLRHARRRGRSGIWQPPTVLGVLTGDTVARFGGDVFVVLLNDVTGAEDAARVAAKVQGAVHAPFRVDGHEV